MPTTPPISATPGSGGSEKGRDTAELRAYLASFLLAAVIGVIGGFAALGFQKLTDLARRLWSSGAADERITEAARNLPWWQALLIPAIGGLVATLLVFRIFRSVAARSTPDILETVSLRRGGIHLGGVLSRSLATTAVIASGGSTGREGPIIQISAAIASTAGRLFRVPPRDLSVLIACGAAAGMAGAYNAPIGGAMFVMEVILGSFVMEQFAPVIVSSVTSALTVRALAGTASVYDVPHFQVASPWEALPIFALGLLAALVGWGFLRTLTWIEDRLQGLRLKRWMLPTLCGLFVGALGIALPEVWGNGYDAVDLMLHSKYSIGLLLLLLPAKALATGVTSGSGIAGGVFTPTLFVGAALGGAFGTALHAAFPHSSLDPGLFALLGMGSVLAATTHAPLMAILVLFEMTDNPALIAPLMLGAVTATLFARWMHADSIYTARLKRRGIRLPDGIEETALLRTYARDLVRLDATTLPAQAPLAAVLDRFLNSRRDALYVVGDGGRYVGVARIHDVKTVFGTQPEGSTIIAMDVAVPVRAVAEDEAIGAVLARFDDSELDEVPVVASVADPRFLGTLSRRDILAMLRHEVLEEPSRPVRLAKKGGAASAYVEMPEGWRIAEVPAPREAEGRPIDVAAWHRQRGEVPLVVLRGDGAGARHPLAPSKTAIRAGDAIVVFGPVPDPRVGA